MLLADMMVHPVNTSLQIGEESFDPVRGDAQAVLIPDVLIGRMVDLIVPTAHESAF